jgi:hypothetical protein
MILLVLFLVLGGTIGYLVAARQDTQANLDSLVDRLDDRLTELEEESGGVAADSETESTSGAREVVHNISGSGSATTDVVSTSGPWRLEWTGDDVFVFVKRAKDGRLVDADGGQGSGSFLIHEDGRFILDVLARGDWVIRILGP